MRAEVAAGAIGEITFVHGRYLCDDVLFPASGWRVDPARSGPSYVVGDLGTHWLDLAEHVTGQHVAEVLADFRSFAGGPLEDYAALLLRFDGGAAGSLVLSAGAGGRKNQLLFEVEGRHGRLHLGPGEADRGCSYRPVDGPKQIVVKDPTTNAESARPLSRYPAGPRRGLRRRVPEPLRRGLRRGRRTSRTRRSRRSATAHAASPPSKRRSRARGAWVRL